MTTHKTNKKLISVIVLVFSLSLILSQSASADDTKKLVYKACTECHDAKRDPKTGKLYWEGQKKAKKEWSSIVNKMQMWGAQLTDQDTNDVIEYLTAMSNGTIKNPTTTTTKKPPATTTTTESAAARAQKTALTATTVAPTTTTTLAPPTSVALTVAVPAKQAKTGIEVIWYLLGGGGLVGSGMAMRNRESRREEEE